MGKIGGAASSSQASGIGQIEKKNAVDDPSEVWNEEKTPANTPWQDTWFPNLKYPTAEQIEEMNRRIDARREALKKYDALMGKSDVHFTQDRFEQKSLEQRNRLFDEIWMYGSCRTGFQVGRLPLPTRPVSLNGVTFTPEDISRLVRLATKPPVDT
jgi:hypothetical protein